MSVVMLNLPLVSNSVKDELKAEPPLPAADGAPPTLAERAYITLRDRLVTLALPPGTPINDVALAHELGVGRTPLREAIKRLEMERLVVVYPRRGTFAAEVNIADLTDVCDVRLIIEPHAATRAAQAASDLDRIQLREVIAKIESFVAHGHGNDPLMYLDMLAHRTVYRCTGNVYLESTLTQYHNLAIRIWCLFVERLPRANQHVAQHVDLLTAILNSDAKTAAELAEAHVRSFQTAILSVIGGGTRLTD
jgi:DNA-binding GntR family transcriptional regulator